MKEHTPDEELDFPELAEKLVAAHSALEEERNQLEVRLGDIRKKIGSIERMLANIGPLTGGASISEFDDISELGITDAAHSVLTRKHRMSAADVKSAMEKRGYDFSVYSAPDATVRTVLNRLVESDKAVIEKEGWKKFYKLPSIPGLEEGPEVSDEDIPF